MVLVVLLNNMQNAGFTLLEVLLSVAAMSIIAGFSAPLYNSFQVRNDLDVTAATIAQSFRRAQIESQASSGDITSGVHIQAGSVTVFRGASYAARDTALDEIFDVPPSITPSGVSDIIFAKFTGLPTTTGTTTLTSNTSEVRTININAKGMVTY